MRHLFKVVVALAGVSSVAAAQSEGGDNRIEDDPFLSDGPSELDELSSGGDPFLDFVEEEARKPLSVTVRALDKITAKYTDITIPIGEQAAFGSLNILARHCDTRPPEEFPETSAFLQIFDTRAKLEALKENAGDQVAEQTPARHVDAREPNISATPGADDPEFAVEGGKIFSGWMFASSPALNALEHPVYDVWVIGCETEVVDEN